MLTTFAAVANPTDVGPPMVDAVPTGIARADDRLYVVGSSGLREQFADAGWETYATGLDSDALAPLAAPVRDLLALPGVVGVERHELDEPDLDTLVLVGIYATYIFVIIRGEVEDHEGQVGVPAYLQEFPKLPRVASVLFLFIYSGTMIFVAVEPFAHGLEALGLQYGIPEFFMIQWIAPLASESPELIVVAYLVNKARSTAGFNALISSKLNQWTLLIGTLAVVYSISAGAVGTLSFDSKQAAEIWITAAQSLFAIAILTNFEISTREAIALLVLFVTQVLAEFYVIRALTGPAATNVSMTILYAYTAVYLVLAAGLFARRRESVRELGARTAAAARSALGSTDGQPSRAD